MRTKILQVITLFALCVNGHSSEGLLNGVFEEKKGWSMVESVEVVEGEKEINRETGNLPNILINDAKFKKAGYLATKDAFGDCAIEIEFMIPSKSNAGVYVQGRYEIQIIDSYGKPHLSFNSMGGVYQQWEPKRKIGYNGVPPLLDAMNPPGEWQKMSIDFRAPRLNEDGALLQYPLFTKVVLNGKTVQTNVPVKGVTRAGRFNGWAAKDKTLIQGDHGPIAIRSFKIVDRDFSKIDKKVMRLVSAPQPKHVNNVKKALTFKAPFEPKKPKLALIFSRTEGFYHGSIPLGDKTLELLGETTGAYESIVSRDMKMFDKRTLNKFDLVIFNNATKLEFENEKHRKNLLDFVKNGKGFVGIHAATDNFYTWDEGAKMIGGQFDGHPWNAKGVWSVKVEQPEHPLCTCFENETFKIKDEIYKIKGPYSRETHDVLLSVDLEDEATRSKSTGRHDKDNPISWIKPYGKGRVFYCSLGHNNRVYWNSEVLQHYLAGIQYALGDAGDNIIKSN